jgi:fumarate hydratase class II
MYKNQMMAALSLVEQTLKERKKELEEAIAEQTHITDSCRMPLRQGLDDIIVRLKEEIRGLEMEIMEYHDIIGELE